MKEILLKAALVMLAVIMIVGISMIPATAASDGYTVTASDETAGTATVTDGEEFTIHITVTGDSFNGLQGALLYDDTLFELKSITGPAAADDPKTKKVELYTLSGTAYADGAEVAAAVFKAKAAGTGTFSVDPITVGDYADFRKGDAVPASAVNDKVTVKSGGGGGGGGSQTGGNESDGSDIVIVPQDSSFRGSTDGEYLSDGSIKITVRDESGNILETVPGGVWVMIPDVQDGQVVVVVDENGKIIDLVEKSLVENHTAYALLQGTATIRIVNNPKSFVDVKDSDWFAGAVAFTSSHELFRGVSDNEFAPQLPMTRAMLVTVLYRLENEPETAGTISFDDVMEGTWYTDVVAWAAENGIVLGYGNELFGPNDNVTREQIATMLYRYMQFLGIDASARGDVSKFGDGSEVSPWAVDAMAWAVGIGLFRGDDTGSLNPGDDATRAEVATLMERLVTMIVKPQR